MVWRESKGHEKSVSFAAPMSLALMLKISVKFTILISHGKSVLIPLPPKVLETVKNSDSVESSSESQFTEGLEYEGDDDLQQGCATFSRVGPNAHSKIKPLLYTKDVQSFFIVGQIVNLVIVGWPQKGKEVLPKFCDICPDNDFLVHYR